jgi:hypothetical protein
MEEKNPETGFDLMKRALALLQTRTPSRENSVAITQLETAMMWHNKDRANIGELQGSPTHV